MQTFLPYPELERSIRCLDNKRLGNQVYREALTLIRGGWSNHPASRMWQPYKVALATYALFGLDELSKRGLHYPHWISYFSDITDSGELVLPPWLGNEEFHSSHRAALLHKLPDWYSQFGWTETPDIPDADGKLHYVWPTTEI